MTEESSQALGRTQKRLLRRVFNGRTVPIVVGGKPFLTYKEALAHLGTLPSEEQDAAYAVMKTFAGKRED
ncbi:hypothetical protein EDF56_10168 [Novosphingobium sp. PhB165]|uniref:hypothetical protein n=1 Tax=Novosphingobium sp. PhB165 TaxID=2485105 RepID=UPI001044FCB3|nr:hypothetical protein [Novosphingobium sp. PhB165]TCM21404.1 hypothetical protein EDF56_10168 [Novosphingobium sp. PhB165]